MKVAPLECLTFRRALFSSWMLEAAVFAGVGTFRSDLVSGVEPNLFLRREPNTAARCLKHKMVMSVLMTTWAALTVTAKFYLLCLLVYAAHTTFVLARTLSLLRHLPNDAASCDATHATGTVDEIVRKLETVRQANALFFLLFGVDFTIEMIAMIRTIGYMSMSLSAATIGIFGPLVTFALFVMVIFTLLHIFQWVATAKLCCNSNDRRIAPAPRIGK
jgi:hypothetical protein